MPMRTGHSANVLPFCVYDYGFIIYQHNLVIKLFYKHFSDIRSSILKVSKNLG